MFQQELFCYSEQLFTFAGPHIGMGPEWEEDRWIRFHGYPRKELYMCFIAGLHGNGNWEHESYQDLRVIFTLFFLGPCASLCASTQCPLSGTLYPSHLPFPSGFNPPLLVSIHSYLGCAYGSSRNEHLFSTFSTTDFLSRDVLQNYLEWFFKNIHAWLHPSYSGN